MSARKLLKVYCTNLDGRYQGVVAASSMASAARALGITIGSMRNYSSVTGNAEQIELAMRAPGVAWRKSYKLGGQWERIELRKPVTGT